MRNGILILLFIFCNCISFGETVSNADLDTVKVVLFPLKKAVISSIVDTSVKKYNFKEGEIFKEGDVVALLDDDLYRNAYNAAKSEYEKAVANYKYTENSYKHDEDLYSKGGLSVQEFEKIKLDRTNSLSEMQMAESALKIAELRLNACTITGPFEGRLTEQLIGEHEFVRAGQPVLETINDSNLLAVMHLSSYEIKNIKEGTLMYFLIDETGTRHEGKVYEVSGYIYSGSRTFEVKAIIENKSRELFAGMSGVLLKKVISEE